METAQKTDGNEGLIRERVIEDEMKRSYLDYAMSVIVGRALPDVRDGLKPVHRRVLFAMHEMGLLHNKPFKKSARIVGDTLGKYHPHGDSAVYDALVRMAQPFSLRYPLVDGQGNFGSIDGDEAASMRYTEARLTAIAEELLEDIDKETVDFVDNFDGSLKEPSVLPSKAPNLLLNGSSGIAVGMATNIPPHNLREVVSAIIAAIDNPEISVGELMGHVKGPDFPTGGIIHGRQGILQAYKTGHGKIIVSSKTRTERVRDREAIIIEEVPFMVNKSQLIEQIAGLVKDKKIQGIHDLRDESDREGIRVVIELNKDAQADVVLNQLSKHSKLRTTFSINLLALVNNEPKLLSLKDMILQFIEHRKEVVRRRTTFELKKAEARAHILEGLAKALEKIDSVIEAIKKSPGTAEAKKALMSLLGISGEQAQAILEMRLSKLTSTEQKSVLEELSGLRKSIQRLKEILSSEALILGIIKDELRYLSEKYGDERRTEIEEEELDDIDMEDLIEEENQIITITQKGYAKRQPLDAYRQQNRGGRGVIGTQTKEEDFVEHLFVANTHSYLLCFTDRGSVHWLKVYQMPEGGRTAKGKPLVNLIELSNGESINAVLPVKEFRSDLFLIKATKRGIVKKTPLVAYSRPRRGGIKAITLEEGDSLINAAITDGSKDIMLATRKGLAIRFSEKDVRAMGRSAHGVIGVRLKAGDEVVGMVLADDSRDLLTVTERGYGKRTPISHYRRIRRGGHGVINIQNSPRNGDVVAVKSVEGEDEVMVITRKGILIRIPVRTISRIGRNTQGVRIMRLDEDDLVVNCAKVVRE